MSAATGEEEPDEPTRLPGTDRSVRRNPHAHLRRYVDSFMNIRVADINAIYDEWSAAGAAFLTPPQDRGSEIRCYVRDPDGYLIEVGQSTGALDSAE
jgi:catechol 2,3-dioxygenase-like lactoylglutathione lyase family enzyme